MYWRDQQEVRMAIIIGVEWTDLGVAAFSGVLRAFSLGKYSWRALVSILISKRFILGSNEFQTGFLAKQNNIWALYVLLGGTGAPAELLWWVRFENVF